MAAFALPLFIWSAFNADYFDLQSENFIIPLAVFFGGPLAIAAAMWAYQRQDAYLATAAAVFGAFWLSHGLFLWLMHQGVVDRAAVTTDMRGLLFVGWAVTFGMLWLASMREHWSLSLVTLGAAAMFVLLAIGYYREAATSVPAGSNVVRAAGWVGFVTAGLAWYSALAEVLNAEFAQPLLPTGPEWFQRLRLRPR